MGRCKCSQKKLGRGTFKGDEEYSIFSCPRSFKRKFLETGARIKINGNQIMVHLKKKTHLPILFEVPWKNQIIEDLLNADIEFVIVDDRHFLKESPDRWRQQP
jgi:hypothetical protein